MHKDISFILLAVIGTSPALAERSIVTPSGQPEAVFHNATVADASAKVASTCMDLGWQVASQTPNQVTCEVPMGMWQSVMTQVLIGNSYSTTPKSFVAINLVQLNTNVRAQSRAWTETQMAFGQMRQHQFKDDKTFENLMGFLSRAGAQPPQGTRFTGNWVGFDTDPASNNTSALTVTKVFPTSPAEAGGLKVGDQVIRIDGNDFKNAADFQKKLKRIKSATYSLTIRRGGQEITLNLQRMSRPAVGTPAWNVIMGQPQANTSNTTD